MSTTPTGFRQRLREELEIAAAHRPDLADFPPSAPQRRSRVPVAVGAAALALGGAVVLPIAYSGSAPAAYAVTADDDGSVLIELNKPSGLPGLQDALRKAGVNAVVMQASSVGQCTDPQPAGLPAGESVRVHRWDDPLDSLRINPAAMPTDATFLLVADTIGEQIVLSSSVTNSVPACVPSTTTAIEGTG